MAAFNHVGAGLICKACRQPFVKFCPSSGRPARFCSACGSPLDWRSDSSSRVREQHDQVGNNATHSSSPLRRKGYATGTGVLRKSGSDDEDAGGRRRGRGGGGGGGGYDGGMGGLLLAPVLNMRKPPTGAVAIAGTIGMVAILALVWSSTLGVQLDVNLRGTPAALTPQPTPLRLDDAKNTSSGRGSGLSWMAWKTASNQTSRQRAQVLTSLPGDQPLDVAQGMDSKLGQTLLVVLLVTGLAYTLYWKGLLVPVACACCKLVAKMKSDYDQSCEEAAAIEEAAAERQSRRYRKSSGHHSSRSSRSKGKGHLSASLVDDGFHSCDEQDECGRKLVANDRAILEGMQASIRERLTSRWTAEELSKVRKLASFIQEQTSYSSKEAELALVSAFGCSDRCAWRFLRSTGWNLKQARQRFLETASWRVNVLGQRPGLDGSMAFSAKGDVPRKPVTPASLRLFGSEDGRRLFPCVGWDGGLYNRGKGGLAEEKKVGEGDDVTSPPAEPQWWQAKEGSPVELWRVELVDIPELFSKLSEEDVMDAYLEYNERRRHRVNEVGAAGYIVLIDAANFGFSHLGKFMACARQAAGVIGSVGERHYPGSIRRAIIFNAPSFIYTIYRVVQPVLSTATRESVAIHSCSAAEVEELQELLPEGTMEEMIKQLPI